MVKAIDLLIVLYGICSNIHPTISLRQLILSSKAYNNHSQKYHIFDRTKKMASDFENTLRKIKDTTQDIGKNIYDHFNTGFKSLSNKNGINEDDVRHYEQLVIMKKYPYLDIRELDTEFLPISFKRHSDRLYLDRNEQREPSINEQEDVLNVEITNRGLSGFAIPPQISKHAAECSSKNSMKSIGNSAIVVFENKPKNQNVLKSLKEDINAYIERKV